MAFDPSVIGNIGADAVPDIVGGRAKAYTLKGMEDEQQMRGMQLKEATQEMSDKDAARSALQGVDVTKPEEIYKAAAKLRGTAGMKLVGEADQRALAMQQQQELHTRTLEHIANTDKAQVEIWQDQADTIAMGVSPVLDHYNQLLAKGMRPSDAMNAVQSEASAAFNTIRGSRVLQDPQHQQQIASVGEKFDPVKWGAALSQSKKAQDLLRESRAQRSTEQHQRTMEGIARQNAGLGGSGKIQPEELDLAITTVMADPTRMRDFATYGKAGQGRRDQIQQGIAQRLKETGMTPADLVRLRANAKAELGSIQKLTAQQNSMTAFEKLAKFNGERVLELLDKVDATGIPMIEGIRRKGAAALGGVDAAEFRSVLTTFQQETARILSNPNMTGVVTDSLRNEIMTMTPEGMSTDQGKRVIRRLFTEMDVRKSAIDEQITTAGASLVPGAAPAPAATGGQVVDWSALK